MKRFLACTSLAAVLMAAPAFAQDKLSRSDQTFVKEAAGGNLSEVELGKLGQEKGRSPEVKKLADTILADHEAANQQLSSIASRKSMQLPQTPPKGDMQERDRLAKLNGGAFDREYAQLLVKDHQKDISAFEKEAKSGQDPDIKAFAAQTLPKLKEHLQLAEAAAKTARTSSRAPSSSSGSSRPATHTGSSS